jgi:hypothetical protein
MGKNKKASAGSAVVVAVEGRNGGFIELDPSEVRYFFFFIEY